jgi:hypothetical protein
VPIKLNKILKRRKREPAMCMCGMQGEWTDNATVTQFCPAMATKQSSQQMASSSAL